MRKYEIFWAIYGKIGLYTGTWFTKKEAIGSHCMSLQRTWKECRSRGDRAVKIKVTIPSVKP